MKSIFARKFILLLALLLIFLAVVGVAVQVAKRTVYGDVFFSTTSPNGSYVVRLTGRKDRPTLPIVMHWVGFSVSKNGKVSSRHNYFHSGDWFDPSFELSYPQQNWVAENVLHFYRDEHFNKSGRGSIVVHNNTDKVIEHLRVESGDSYLLFDIQPWTMLTLTVSAPRSGGAWIQVEGKFSERQRIKETSMNFLIGKDQKGPFTYFVSVNEDGVIIDSPGLEKY